MSDKKTDRNLKMLYKHPGPHKIHGSLFDYIVTPACYVEERLREGWSLSTDDALKYKKPPSTPSQYIFAEAVKKGPSKKAAKKVAKKVTSKKEE